MPGNPAPSQIAASVAGVSPQTIYQQLTAAGATPNQAAGIMGNFIAESTLNPEAAVKDSNGYWSYGLAQWNTKPGNYPNAASLVTGHPAADLVAQIKFLAATGGFKAASGSTPQQAGANFAATYERCQGCAAGGGQNSQRAANAAAVAGYVASGKWPQSISPAGNGLPGNTGKSTTGQGQGQTPGCLVSLPSVSLGPVHLGGQCLFSDTEARAIVGGLMIAAGGGVLLVGLALLLAAGLNSGPGRKVAGGALEAAGAAASVAGAPEAGVPLAAAGAGVRRSGTTKEAQTQVQRRGERQITERKRTERETRQREAHEGRQYDEVMARKRDSAKGPAPRPGRELEPVPF